MSEYTPNEALAELLMETRACRRKLGAIAGWIALMGICLLIAIAFSACNVLLSI